MEAWDRAVAGGDCLDERTRLRRARGGMLPSRDTAEAERRVGCLTILSVSFPPPPFSSTLVHSSYTPPSSLIIDVDFTAQEGLDRIAENYSPFEMGRTQRQARNRPFRRPQPRSSKKTRGTAKSNVGMRDQLAGRRGDLRRITGSLTELPPRIARGPVPHLPERDVKSAPRNEHVVAPVLKRSG